MKNCMILVVLVVILTMVLSGCGDASAADLEKCRAEVTAGKGQLTDANDKIDKQETIIAEQSASLTSQSTTIAEQGVIIAEQSANLTSQSTTIAEQETTIAELSAQVAELQAAAESISFQDLALFMYRTPSISEDDRYKDAKRYLASAEEAGITGYLVTCLVEVTDVSGRTHTEEWYFVGFYVTDRPDIVYIFPAISKIMTLEEGGDYLEANGWAGLVEETYIIKKITVHD